MLTELVRDVGAGRWQEGPYLSWVSKTDVYQYLRCPYKVYQSYTKKIPYSDFITPAARETLLDPGTAFEESIIPKIGIDESADLERDRAADLLLKPRELIRNHELGIQGFVDIVATEKGALIPIEVKSHRRVLRSDKLELAFYWKLLEPLRTGDPAPMGYTLSDTGDRIEVELKRRDFNKLEKSIADIRRIRVEGTELAIVPECKYCTFKEEHVETVRGKGGLTRILDIGWKRQQRLNSLEILNIGDLARADTVDLYTRWRGDDQYAPNLELLRQMQSHAGALFTDRPYYIGDGAFPFVDRALLLDLEYDSGQCIFLIGAAVLEDGVLGTPYQLFAETRTDERQILEMFSELVRGLPEHWILTWSGLSADIPQLRSAWARHDLHPDMLDVLQGRHIDLYQVAYANVRWPIEGLGLTDVADYLGYRRKRGSLSGFDMPFLYRQFLSEQDKSEKSSIRERILTHNVDDLKALALVWDRLQTFVHDNLVRTSDSTTEEIRK